MKYVCKAEGCEWNGEVKSGSSCGNNIELVIRGRGTKVNVVLGTCSLGNYLFIPQFDCGCQLADFSDTYWNIEQLADKIGIADATTIATGIKIALG